MSSNILDEFNRLYPAVAGVLAGVALAVLLSSPAAAQGLEPEDEVEYATFRSVPKFRAYLPAEVDLSPKFPKPGNQGDQGSCTAWATGYALRTYYEYKNYPPESIPLHNAISPAFLYNQVKSRNSNCLVGTRISSTLKFLQNTGAVTMADFPYSREECSRQPPQTVLSKAGDFRINDWQRINFKKLDDVKGQLAAGHPVVFGMYVSDPFLEHRSDAVYNRVSDRNHGFAHAMVLVGYSDKRRALKLMNSWGSDWGNNGFAWVAYDAFVASTNSAFTMRAPSKELPKPKVVAVVTQEPVAPVPQPAPEPKPVIKKTPKPQPAPEPKPVVKVAPKPQPAPEPKPVVKVAPKPQPQPKPVAKVVAKVTPKPPPKPVRLSKADVKQKVRAVLNQFRCAGFSFTQPARTSIALNGYLASEKDLLSLKQGLEKIPSLKTERLNVAVRTWPQCEAMQTFAEPLLTPRGLTVKALSAKGGRVLTEGEKLIVEVTTPDFPSYVYVTYLQAGGDAVHLIRPDASGKPYPPNKTLTFGNDPTKISFEIASPFGKEMIIAVATSKPLEKSALEIVEEERSYLSSFRQAILQQIGENRKGPAAATYGLLTTRPKAR
ncbi:MAG: DUF4384 domain-containing protein [Rhodospirillales bacterium]|nr:DUF4384 domain-containing protein [Rhodospirillales bacterium]